jgi:MinD-like ATPase involved in chromosome partitioning or flagellar assembly
MNTNDNDTHPENPTPEVSTPLQDPSAISQQLRSLYRAGVASSLSEPAQTITEADCQRYEEFFRLARFAIRYTLHTDLLTEAAEKCRFLFDAGKYVKEVGDFLSAALRLRPMTRSEMALVNRAFESLLSGLRSPSPQIVEQCVSAFDFVLEKLSAEQRHQLKGAIKARLEQKDLGDNLRAIVKSTSIYLGQLTSLDQAFRLSDESIEDGRVISIHSTKGGVGKSTVALALAIHLARNPANKVCLVDADDEGPALEFYLPTTRAGRRKAIRFVNWLTSPLAHQWFPEDMLLPLSQGGTTWRDRLTLVAGSIISADIQKLDEIQGPEHSESNQRRICSLAKHLIKEKKFSHVIFDSAPGMAHLALDIFLSTLRLNGCMAIVLRPRVPDIVALATEEAWLTQERLKDRLAVVADFSDESTSAMLKDTELLVSALEKTPIVAAFMDRSPEITPERIADFFRQNWNRLKNRVSSLRHQDQLVHAADIVPDATSSKTIAEVIAEDAACAKMAEELMQIIRAFSTPRPS